MHFSVALSCTKPRARRLRRTGGSPGLDPSLPVTPSSLREIQALEIDGAVSIELEYSPDPERIEEWVTEAYRETDRLLRSAGLRAGNA